METYTNHELLTNMDALRNKRSEIEDQLIAMGLEYEKRVKASMREIEKFTMDKELLSSCKDPVVWEAARRFMINASFPTGP